MMKLFLFSLAALLMADLCWSQCRTKSWSPSFRIKGWSKCGSTTEYVTGLYRDTSRGSDPIFLLKKAKCCKAPAPNQNQASTCKTADWWKLLDKNNKWALCPTGYFLQGLYRTKNHNLGNIEQGHCCKPNNLPNSYLRCYNQDVSKSFNNKGWSNCDDGYYLTGVYRGGCNKLKCIDKFKCCKMNVDINECDNNPCPNGATCVNLQGGYRCNCMSGFTGSNCETDINECAAAPCLNGGTCVDLVGNFRCDCAAGWLGDTCAEQEMEECQE